MPPTKTRHHDRGDGICSSCLARWPCNFGREGVDEWVASEKRKIFDRNQQRWEPMYEELTRIMIKWNLDFYLPHKLYDENWDPNILVPITTFNRMVRDGLPHDKVPGDLVFKSDAVWSNELNLKMAKEEFVEVMKEYDSIMDAQHSGGQALGPGEERRSQKILCDSKSSTNK